MTTIVKIIYVLKIFFAVHLQRRTNSALASKDEINTKGWEAILQMGKQAEEAGIQDISLDEINAIIKEARDAR